MILQDSTSILTGQIFDIHLRSTSRDFKTLGVPPLANKFCALQGVDWQSCRKLMFVTIICCLQIKIDHLVRHIEWQLLVVTIFVVAGLAGTVSRRIFIFIRGGNGMEMNVCSYL